MVAHGKQPRDFAGLEHRRKQAAHLFAKGETQASVARQLKASRQSVSRWHRQWKSEGLAGLRAAGRAGRKPRLSARQLGRVDAALRQGARQHGFSADLWTLPRVATVIERITGERFHPGHVWKLLGSLGLERAETCAAGQGTERGEGPILGGGALAGRKKNARRQQAWIYFQDESGFTQQPSVRTSWAPRGQTPVLKSRGNHWDKTSVAAALGFRWDGQKTRLFARTKKDSFNTASLIAFLKQLKCFVHGQRVILIWDHLPAHRSREMSQFLCAQRDWLHIEWLPGYAPDLNPTEGVWSNIKGREMANLCPELMTEATATFRRGLRRVGHTRRLPFSFLRHAGLSL